MAALIGAASAAAAELVTEEDVVRIARAEDPELLAARYAIAVAEAEEIRASLYPNPSLDLQRENLPAGSPTNEDSLFVTVPIEFTGRRPAERALARSAASGNRARAARTRSAAVVRSLGAFYSALAAEREVEILARAVAGFEEAARIVKRRHEEGTTSGYERARLEIEGELALSDLREAETRSRAARATLAGLIAANASTLELRGDLATVEPPTEEAPPEPPSIRLLRTAEVEARKAGVAASWAGIPTLSLSGGIRAGQWDDTPYGYVAGLSLSLPVLSRGQELVAESEARRRLAAAEVSAAERETRIDLARSRAQLVGVRAEIARFAHSTRDRIELLGRAAASAYREGDLSVADLVDASRARTEIDRRRLELDLLAKRSELKLRAARGEFE